MASCLSLGEQDIHVWLAFYEDMVDERLRSNLRGLLNDSERRQAQRFHFADDRQRYLVTRAMVRTVLSRYAAVAAADWLFATNAYGRPEIANDHDEAQDLCFNVSHTRGLIALGVARRRALGIDVENLAARQAPMGIAERFFAPVEVADLARARPAHRHDRFFEYWTFKESYIKARGMGLSLPLDRFSFHFPHEGSAQIVIDPELGDDPSHWGFWQLRPAPGYLLALCAQRLDRHVPALTVRTMVPTVAEDVVDVPVLRHPRPSANPLGRCRSSSVRMCASKGRATVGP